MKLNKCKVIVVANQKGGAAKSTSANLVAYGLARIKKGCKVLLIDFDPQASQTNSFIDGLEDNMFISPTHPSNIGLIFQNKVPKTLLIQDNLEEFSIHFLPANDTLVDYAESTEMKYDEKIFALRNYINKIKIDYDYIVIDTQPLFGVLTKSALVIADLLFVPIATRAVDENGMKRFFEKTNELLGKYHTSIEKIIIMPTMYSKVKKESTRVLNAFKLYKNFICAMENFIDTKVTILKEFPERTSIQEAAAYKCFLIDYVNNVENSLVSKQKKELIDIEQYIINSIK
jgi:chromosome partitioning protein